MDTTAANTGQQVDVQARITLIKDCMPLTYQAIQDKAKSDGKAAFALVRRALRGEPNCFYAIEAGHVVGAPFNLEGVGPEIAKLMCQFGFSHLVMWAAPTAAPVDATQGT